MIDRDELIRLRKGKGFSQPNLAVKVGCSQQLIGAIETGTTKSTKFLPKMASVLGVPPSQLDPDYEAPVGTVPAQIMGSRDFPIHAAVEGGRGQIILSTDPVDYQLRPSPVASVRDAYGLYVVGESMVPEYRPGDIAIVDPHLPVVSDEIYIFYSTQDGETKATIKHLRRATPDSWLVSQWNPPAGAKADFTLSRKEWTICHRVLGKYSRR